METGAIGRLARRLGRVGRDAGPLAAPARRGAEHDAPVPAAGALCVAPFTAVVRTGPSAGLELRGLLYLGAGADGAIDAGVLALDRAEPGAEIGELPVVGQTRGRALSLRIELGAGRALVGAATLELPLARCDGAMGGRFVGPLPGDAGDWAWIVPTAAPDFCAGAADPCRCRCRRAGHTPQTCAEPGRARSFCQPAG